MRAHVNPAGSLEITRHRPWASVGSIALADGRRAWFKACRPVQVFEPRLTAELAVRWPDRVVEVIAHDVGRGWLLTLDAGRPIDWSREALGSWLAVLPRYAELQLGEAPHVGEHLEHGVPDLRLDTLPGRLEALLASNLPLASGEVERLRAFLPLFAERCAELAAAHPVASVQHDDLHGRSVFHDGAAVRVTDWGDASIGQPLFSLVRLDLSIAEAAGGAVRDRWFPRLRDAYLEPWGTGGRAAFELAHPLGLLAHALTWGRHRSAMAASPRAAFDGLFEAILRRALTAAIQLGG